MSWANCGYDSTGRRIGYSVEATCDHPGCNAKIDRGLSYACGGFHGDDNVSCEKYFCSKHMVSVELHPDDARASNANTVHVLLCKPCAEAYHATENGKIMADE